jgi:hypothetical protein
MKQILFFLNPWLVKANTPSDNPSATLQLIASKLVNIYSGELHAGTGQPLGQGKVTYPNGDVYEGAVEGVPHGEGKLTFMAGDVYEGEMDRGWISGLGKKTWTNGDVYEGMYLDGKEHG